jgi:hypothetical protein
VIKTMLAKPGSLFSVRCLNKHTQKIKLLKNDFVLHRRVQQWRWCYDIFQWAGKWITRGSSGSISWRWRRFIRKTTTGTTEFKARLTKIKYLRNSLTFKSSVILFRVSDASGQLVIEEVGQKPLQQSMLKREVNHLFPFCPLW